MRFDAKGLFWEEVPMVMPRRGQAKKTVTVEKRQPPERTWERPDYLPDVEEAKAFFPTFEDDDLVAASQSRERFVFDIECYSNYFLVCFKSLSNKKVVCLEQTPAQMLHRGKLAWMIRNLTLIGFNSRAYDMPLLQLALTGADCGQLKEASDKIIKEDTPGWKISVEIAPPLKHIDLIEVAPLDASLKLYGGRLHCPRMWDLPFPPEAELNSDQMHIVRSYCVNDLDLTEILYDGLHEQIALRERLELEYGLELCSLSDAQMAEAVISKELTKLGVTPRHAKFEPGASYKYIPPAYMQFHSAEMKAVFARICAMDFIVGEDGYITVPEELNAKVTIPQNPYAQYQMGIGGLHSCEKAQVCVSDNDYVLVDRDVTSYYPAIILNCHLTPEHLGDAFLTVYHSLVKRRIEAKRQKLKVVADCFKIVVNGSFGKLGSKWSVLYQPNLLLQVTLTGQLSLLMLIERMESIGVQVVSANTDGLVMKIPRFVLTQANLMVAEWERETGFETEATEYQALYSRDVNNYIAVKPDGKTKNKGAFANPWAEDPPTLFRLHKNPTTTICIEAVEAYLTKGTPLLDTITWCRDIRKFISIRTVKGGAVQGGTYLGKAIRWYYSKENRGEIVYAATGNRVAKSEGAMALMRLPDTVPADLDHAWYVREAENMLTSLGIKT